MCCLGLLYALGSRFIKFLQGFYSVINEQDNSSKKNRTNDIIDKTELKAVTDLLTEREQDVFALLVKGYTNAQIANQLCLSMGTVKNYVSVIYDKIGMKDRTVLVLKYSPYYREYD
jgi:DNA-binding NarL/FixJ family response regulator